MIAKVQVKIGGSSFQFEVNEGKTIDVLHEIIVFGNPPQECGLCKGDVRLDTNKSGGYTFINVLCTLCGAKSKLGQYKDGGYFWHQFKKWQGNDEAPDDNDPVVQKAEKTFGNDIQAPRAPRPANPPAPPSKTKPLSECHLDGCDLPSAENITGFCSEDHKTKYWGKSADTEKEKRDRFEFSKKA